MGEQDEKLLEIANLPNGMASGINTYQVVGCEFNSTGWYITLSFISTIFTEIDEVCCFGL